MATSFNSFFLTIFTLNLFFGFHVYAVPYDYSYTLGCVPKPEPPQYNGGVVVNPELNEGLKGWTAVGNAKIEIAKSPDGNNYIVASNMITELSDGFSQTFNMEREKLYTFSAWFQVSQGEAKVLANLKTSTGNITAGWFMAKSGCWTMVKGGLVVNVTESAELHFEIFNATGVDIWVDSISLQPFTQEEWTSHLDQNVEKARKTNVKFEAVDQNGQPLANATVSIRQLQPNFPLGCVLSNRILSSLPYQKWFLERFTYTVFENQLKWSFNEDPQGVENYTVSDAMVEFAKSNGVLVRGHNVLWEDPKWQLPWVNALPAEELKAAAVKRINSVVSRYKGQVIHWDVINENMHFNQFSSLFPGKGSDIFNLVHEIDPAPLLFLNEYNAVEDNSVYGKAVTPSYLAKIDEIKNGGYDGPLGIGLECHFDFIDPNIPYVRASLDAFASTGLPIWITEYTVGPKMKNQVKFVGPLLREFHSHAAVHGILIWSAVGPDGICYSMCLTDGNFNNVPAGDAVDDFLYEFIKVADSNGTTDSNGVFEASLVHGEYEANVTIPGGASASASQTFNLVPKGDVTTVQLKINV